MSNKKRQRKVSKLSREILGLFCASEAIAVFFFMLLSVSANIVVMTYCEKTGNYLSEIQEVTVQSWIRSISLSSSGICFVALFLLLLGQKLSYLREIIRGIEALRTHHMEYVMPLEGDNEFTELAESINYLAETERNLMQKEIWLREEKEELFRSLSHDIRTPLTAILSYAEYMTQKEGISREKLLEFAELIGRKGRQIKDMTDRLLDGGKRSVEYIEDGRLLMEQLVLEWCEMLEEKFVCKTDLEDCQAFSGEFDVEELRRIFDNLASNIKKYAAPEEVIKMKISVQEKCVVIEQINKRRILTEKVESRNIGLGSVRRIVENYRGTVDVLEDGERFYIKITLFL